MKTKHIVLTIVSIFLVIVFLVLFLIVRLITAYRESDHPYIQKRKEYARLHRLPHLEGVFVKNESKILAPMSKDSVTFLALDFDFRGKFSDSISVTPTYDVKTNLYYPEGLKMRIDGIEYPINFKKAIIESYGKASERKIFSIAKGMRDTALLKEQMILVSELEGEHEYVDFFLDDDIDNVIIREYQYKTGDTLSIKGKIKNGRLIPLY